MATVPAHIDTVAKAPLFFSLFVEPSYRWGPHGAVARGEEPPRVAACSPRAVGVVSRVVRWAYADFPGYRYQARLGRSFARVASFPTVSVFVSRCSAQRFPGAHRAGTQRSPPLRLRLRATGPFRGARDCYLARADRGCTAVSGSARVHASERSNQIGGIATTVRTQTASETGY